MVVSGKASLLLRCHLPPLPLLPRLLTRLLGPSHSSQNTSLAATSSTFLHIYPTVPVVITSTCFVFFECMGQVRICYASFIIFQVTSGKG